MTFFNLYLVDMRRYYEIVAYLARVEVGDVETLRTLMGRCREALDAPVFLRWNDPDDPRSDMWKQRIGRATFPSEAAAGDIAGIAIGLLCIPEFQYGYLPDRGESPSIVTLGNRDGGMYASLSENSWFETLFLDAFHDRSERYHLGKAMFFLRTDEAEHLRTVLAGMSEATAVSEAWRDARTRLVALASRAITASDSAIAVVEW